jgi:hypothetical protein
LDHESLRQRIINYWIAYLSELRREITNYVSDPTSKQMPVFYRTHRRYVDLYEFDDGYAVILSTVPEEEFDQVGYWETFRVTPNHEQTLGAATGRREFPPYGDFLVSDPRPIFRDVETGEYADPMPPESVEGRKFVSNNRVDTDLTEEMGREQAGRELREFFAANPPQ